MFILQSQSFINIAIRQDLKKFIHNSNSVSYNIENLSRFHIYIFELIRYRFSFLLCNISPIHSIEKI